MSWTSLPMCLVTLISHYFPVLPPSSVRERKEVCTSYNTEYYRTNSSRYENKVILLFIHSQLFISPANSLAEERTYQKANRMPTQIDGVLLLCCLYQLTWKDRVYTTLVFCLVPARPWSGAETLPSTAYDSAQVPTPSATNRE